MTNTPTPRAAPESFRARALTASLTVNDLTNSLGWYRDVLGFTVDEKYEREGKVVAVTLKAGDVELLINQDDGAKGLNRVKGVGFSLQFTTVQDIDTLAEGIVARGGKLDTELTDMPWGARIFRLRDPDGFRMTFSMDKAT